MAIQAGASLETKTSAWTVTYHLDQVLVADPENPKHQPALNSDAGLTDGDPNPIKWFANVSLVGSSPIRSRANDTIGIGYYHLQASNLAVLTEPRVHRRKRRAIVLQRGRHSLVPCALPATSLCPADSWCTCRR